MTPPIPRIRKLAVILGTSALLGGAVAGCGAANSSSSTGGAASPSGASTTAPANAPSGQNGQPGSSGSSTDPRAEMAAALARALDLSQAKVAAALEAVMPARPANGQGGAPPSGTGSATTQAS